MASPGRGGFREVPWGPPRLPGPRVRTRSVGRNGAQCRCRWSILPKGDRCMRSIPRAAVPLALAAGLVAAPPPAADAKAAPEARASGSAPVELIYPSIVRVRVGRAERALDRATKRIEHGEVAKAALSLKVVRRQTAAAWRGAKYVVRTAPPPVAPEDRHVRARASDDAVGPTYASPAESAFAVLTLQHDVTAAVVQLIDGSHGTGL